MAGLPVIGLGTLRFELRIGREEAGRFHVHDELRIGMQLRKIARQHHADLVGEDLVAIVVDDAAAVAIAVEAEADIGAGLAHLVGDRMKHLHVFGIGIVAREAVIEVGVEWDHLASDHLEHLRREGTGGAVAARGDDLQLALQFGTVGEIGNVAVPEIGHELDSFRPRAA